MVKNNGKPIEENTLEKYLRTGVFKSFFLWRKIFINNAKRHKSTVHHKPILKKQWRSANGKNI